MGVTEQKVALGAGGNAMHASMPCHRSANGVTAKSRFISLIQAPFTDKMEGNESYSKFISIDPIRTYSTLSITISLIFCSLEITRFITIIK